MAGDRTIKRPAPSTRGSTGTAPKQSRATTRSRSAPAVARGRGRGGVSRSRGSGTTRATSVRVRTPRTTEDRTPIDLGSNWEEEWDPDNIVEPPLGHINNLDEPTAVAPGDVTVDTPALQLRGAIGSGINSRPSITQVTSDISIDASASANLMSAITNIVKSAVDGVKDSVVALSESGSRAGNSRILETQKLPEFHGDPFEWLNFKEAYEDSTKANGFSDRENIQRLAKAIHGKARETVKMLLATTRDPSKIMHDLELHFGNSKMIAESVKRELINLPALNSQAINIAQFSSKLSNTVTAFKSLNFPNKLHDSSLFASVHTKLPREMQFAFRTFAARDTSNVSNLEKLADYMQIEAEISNDAGLYELETPLVTDPKHPMQDSGDRGVRPARTAAACTAVVGAIDPRDTSDNEPARKTCRFCQRANHELKDCISFKKLSALKKHQFVRSNRLCFRCAGTGHTRRECRAVIMCDICKNDKHLTSLHMSQDDWDRIRDNRDANSRGQKNDNHRVTHDNRRDRQHDQRRDNGRSTSRNPSKTQVTLNQLTPQQPSGEQI